MNLLEATGGWGTAIGTAIGILGVVYGVWARNHPKKTKLSTAIETTSIGLPNDPKIEVRYDGQVLTAPTVTRLTVAHVDGPEIPEITLGAVAFTCQPNASGKVVAVLNESSEQPTVVLLDGEPVLKPRIFKAKEAVTAAVLSDGDPVFEARVRIAGVAQVKGERDRFSGRFSYGFLAFAIAWLAFTALAVTVLAEEASRLLYRNRGEEAAPFLAVAVFLIGVAVYVLMRAIRLVRSRRGLRNE